VNSVRLSAADAQQLQQAAQLLLSPLVEGDLDAWRAPVVRSIAELLGANRTTFILPLPGAPVSYCEGSFPLTPEFCANYLRAVNADEERLGIIRKMVMHGASLRRLIYTSDVYRSAYYADWIVSTRSYDSASLATRTPEGVSVHIISHHDRPHGRRFGDRGLTLLRLLLPAFRVGAETRVRYAHHREQLGAFIDGLADALVVVDHCGRLAHVNRAAGDLLSGDPYARRLDPHFSDLAREIVSLLRAVRRDPAQPVLPVRHVATPFAGYRLSAFVPPTDFSLADVVLIRLERTGAADAAPPGMPVNAELLRERLRLTRREIAVATMLAARRTDAEIAAALCVSPHTARHHCEHVRAKLGVRSRRDVAARLLAADQAGS
jgi:DNA-binding CsgD family transcriptional regulator/PAS domain-containing protein